MQNTTQTDQTAIDRNLLLAEGVELTIDHDIIDSSGQVIFLKGLKVRIREVWKTEGKWSNLYSMFVPEVIHGIKLEDISGIWFLSCFSETKNACR